MWQKGMCGVAEGKETCAGRQAVGQGTEGREGRHKRAGRRVVVVCVKAHAGEGRQARHTQAACGAGSVQAGKGKAGKCGVGNTRQATRMGKAGQGTACGMKGAGGRVGWWQVGRKARKEEGQKGGKARHKATWEGRG